MYPTRSTRSGSRSRGGFPDSKYSATDVLEAAAPDTNVAIVATVPAVAVLAAAVDAEDSI